MICQKCSSPVADSSVFCPRCGCRLDSQKACRGCQKVIEFEAAYCPYCGFAQTNGGELSSNAGRPQNPDLYGNPPQPNVNMQHDNAPVAVQSRFTGGLLGKIGNTIVANLIITLTLGIGYPWAVCYKQKWYVQHTYINGTQLQFNGTGGQLLGNYMKWFFLSVITFGIYALWLSLNMKKWVVKHTVLGDSNEESSFNGSVFGYFGVRLAAMLLTLFTLGIGLPWAMAYRHRWYARHTVYSGQCTSFDGTGGQLLGNYIKWMLLGIVTLGIYYWWLPLKLQKWVVSHTHIAAADFEGANPNAQNIPVNPNARNIPVNPNARNIPANPNAQNIPFEKVQKQAQNAKIFGILSLALIIMAPGINAILGIIAIVYGASVMKSTQDETVKKTARLGLITSIIGVVLALIFIIVYVLFMLYMNLRRYG